EHVDGLAHARTTEQTHLTAFSERADQVDHLNTGLEQLNGRRQLVERRCILVNGASFFGLNGTALVNGATQHVHNATQGGYDNRHRNGDTSFHHGHATAKPVGRDHGNSAHHTVNQ